MLVRQDRTQELLTTGLGLSAGAVSHRLTGRTPWDVNELVKVAGLLGVSLATLLDGVELEAAS